MKRSNTIVAHSNLIPSSPDVHLNLGLTLRGLGDMPAAEESFRKAIKADPLYAPGYRDLGSLLLVQGKIDVARSFLETKSRHRTG